MVTFRRLLSVLALTLLAFAGAAQAQTYTYHVYIDSDLRDTTGCTVSGGGQSFVGADYRLTATVTGAPPRVTGRTLSTCSAGSFGAGTALSANYPVGLNNGIPVPGGSADVIELAIGRGSLPGVEPQVRVGFAAQSASGSLDILYTANGQVGGPAMIVGSPEVIPTLGFFGALLLALALAAVALRTLKRNRLIAQMLLIGAFFSLGLAAWAANFIADGQVGDWAASSPIGSDPIGDPVPNLSATDMAAVFGADERPNLFFRIDVVDAENQPPVAVADAYTTLEDQPLTVAAPGVLGNDSDPDGDPITAQVVTGPTRGTLTLSPNGGFTYTPNANANGTDTFTYSANDGQATSTPATVTITITPVNDVPVFTAGANQTVLEDAGAQTVNPWATAISDGDPEVVQSLTFQVTNNTNAALFSAAPAISPTGVLTYTPAANANGSATITLRLQDDGGTANGGVDTSATQSFTITVTAVNDAPSFVKGADQTVFEDAGAQTITPWATAISAGPADESGQTLTFNVTGNSNAALFSVAPAMSPTGTLTYTPAANAVGSATITLTLSDNGGTAGGGIDTSAAQTFTITVTGVNDAPSFTKGPDQTVLEDAGAQTVSPWATAIDDGDPDVVQGLTFQVTNNTNAALFSAAPAISPTGALTYTPAANANGTATITLRLQDDGGTANGGVDSSATQTFVINVTAVNDAPSLTASNPPTVLEDAAAVNIPAWATFTAGPADEGGQSVLGYQISAISNPALFAAAPAVANNGTLSYTLAPNANGSSSFTVRVQDSGGTANGGVDLSAAQTFTVTVTNVNDVPSFTKGADQTVLEDAGAQTVNPWATAISDGDPEVVQGLTFTVTNNTNAALFSAGPAISPTGVLTYTPAANANGTATITLRLQDDGGTANGGVDTSATQTFVINVTPVNDAPSYTKGADQSVSEDAGAQTANPWATAISRGPADEAGQTLTFNVTGNSNPALFSAAPAVSPTGVLTYTPAANSSGSATITLTLSDNGGTANGGVDTSPAQTFVITVTAVNDAPVNTVPVAQNTGDSVPLVLSTANTNAISVTDIDAAAGIVQMSFGTGNLANGSLTLANPGAVLTSLTGNGTELVIATGTLTALNTALNGPSGSLTYTPVGGTTAARTITVITNDQGNTGSGGALIDTDTITVNVDAPPVVSSTPANGATIANNASITVNFSESVNVIAGITLTCGGPNLITGGNTGAAVSTLNLTYTAPLPAGSCTLSVPAASVSDVDVIDPPNNPAASYSATFSVDAAPAVTTTTPTNGSTTANNVALQVNFSELVDATNAVTLSCGGGPNLITGGATATGVNVLNLTYAGSLPSGPCVLTVLAAAINDSDVADPPQNPVANTVINFTVDAAPTVTGGTPVNAATGIGTGTAVTFTFDEAVNATANAITLNCGGPITGVLSGSASTTLTFTPGAALPANTACTATAVATEITDVDAFDPPNNLAANSVRTFTTDAAPTVTGTTPAAGATSVPLAGVVTFTFSENVNFTAASFSYTCGVGITFTATGTGTNTATLTPVAPTPQLPINTLCTVTALAAGITDTDAGDPPDNMAANFPISFTSVNDNPPAVVSTEVEVGNVFTALPLGGGIGSDSNTAIRLTFNEAVNPSGAWAQLLCSISGSRTVLSGLAVTTADPVFTLTPTVNLTEGDACTLTVFAALVVDDDAIDPPDNMAANYVVNFNVDSAPRVSSVLPGNGATNIATNSTITVNFSEPVNVAAGGVTLNCGAAVSFGAGLPATNVTSLVLTPTVALPQTATCTGTVVATLVTDVDAGDPPDQMLANFTWSFTTVDPAPTVTTTNPVDTGSLPAASDIVINFSENVTFGPTSFTLECPLATSIPFAVSGSGTNQATLNPGANLPVGPTCTVTVVAANVSDVDAIDPPDNMAANFAFSFTATNSPPVLTAGGTLAYTENAAPSVIDNTITVSDSDSPNLASASAQITTGYVNGEDVLSFTNTPNITGNFAPASGTLTLTGSDTLAAYQAALRNVRYANTSDTPTTASRTVSWIGSDGIAASTTVTSTITVSAVDDNPLAVADAATVVEDSGASAIDVLANDTDVDGGPKTVGAVTQPANGTVVITGGGTGLTYAPNANYCNTPPGTTLDTFTYTLSPGGSSTSVTMTVTCVDDNPTAVADSATVTEDSGANAFNVLANDSDADGGPKSVSAVTQPANGTVVITGGGTGLTYAPNANYCNNPPGTTLDTFTYTLAPGSSSTTVTVTVTCVDDPPTAVADAGTVLEDSGANAINVLANDTDIDAGPKSVTSVTQPANGTVVITGGGTGLTYAPSANYCNNPPGTTLDTFTYTLTPGSSSTTVTMTVTCVNDPPVALADAFDFVGNTELRVDLAAVGTPAAYETTVGTVGVLGNDSDPVEGDTVSVTQLTVGACTDASAPLDCSDPAVGRVQMSATGQFSFTPVAGDAGATETFTYQVSDSGLPSPASATGTVTLTRFERVWYVRNSAAAGGTGTSVAPLNTLAAAETPSLANDYIFVYFGDGTTSGQTAGISLKNGQRLWGEHFGLSLPVNLNGNGAPTNLVAAVANNRPLITNAAANGNAVRILANTANGNRNGVEVRGLSLSGNATAGNAIDVQVNDSATLVGLLIADNVVTSAGAEGIDIVLDNAGAVTNSLALNNNSVTATGIGIDITHGTSNGTNVITGFSNNVVGGNTVGTGIRVQGFNAGNPVTFDASTATAGYQTVAAGTGLVGASGNGVGAAGVLLDQVAGDLSFTDLDVFADAGAALTVNGTAVVNTGAGTGMRITVGSNVSTLQSTGGAALALSSLTADLQGALLTSTNSAGSGVSLIGVGDGTTAASVSGAAASAITNATAADFLIDGGNATVSYAGTITDASGTVVSVANTTGDTKSFTGAIGSGAINLTSNTGATINFSGGLVLNTGALTAFNATGGGTVTVQGATNTLTTTTGTAVNVNATTIGGAGMAFQSINSTTASANTAIVLNNTGAGAFSVTGTGAAGTGGTISNKSVDAVQLNTTGGLVTLNRMIIEDIGNMAGAIDTRSGHDAIQGLTVNGGLSLTGTTIRRISDQAIHGGVQGSPDSATVWNGLTLSGVTIENTNRYHVAGSGDANNEGTVRILGVRGTVGVTNSTFSLGAQPLDLEVTAGALNLTATGNTFDRSYKEFTSGTRASIGNHCIDVRVLAGGTANVVIGDRVNATLGNNFLNCRLGSIRVVNQPGLGANTDAIIARNNFRVNDHSSGIGGDFDFPMGGTLVWNLGAGTVDTIVENNLFELVTNASGGVGQLSLIAEGGPVQALVQNNTFDRPGNAPWWVQSRASAGSVMTARFVANTVIRGAFPCTLDPACGGGYFGPGLRALADAQQGATLNFTMENNVMARHDTGFDPGQTVEVRALNVGAAPIVCSSFLNNQSPDGYSLEQLAGTARTVGSGTCAAGTPSGTCQSVFQANLNVGGFGVLTTNPPFVNVFGTVTVNSTACPVPSGGPF